MKKNWVSLLAVILVVIGFLMPLITGLNPWSAGTHVFNYFASGDFSLGVFAVGNFAAGIFAAGMFSIGIFSIGIFSVGVFSVGIFSVGLSATGFFVYAKRKKTLKDME